MKLFGIPIKIDISFFIMAAVLGWGGRDNNPIDIVLWVVIVLVSVLFHEFGHAFAVKAFGLAPRIQLYGMGGLTSWSGEGQRLSPLKMMAVSLAGPFAGGLLGCLVLLAFLVLPLGGASGPLADVFRDLLWVNFGWGILNLFPLLPLDGGNVMKSFEELITGKPEGVISRVVSLAIALCGAALSLKAGMLWTLILSAWFALINGTALLKQFQARSDRKLGGLLQRARDAVQSGDADLGVRLAEEAFQSAKSDATKCQALQLLVHGHIRRRSFNQAAAELQRLQALAGPDPYLAGLLLLEMGDIAQSISTIEPAFNKTPSKWTGFILGQAYIKAQRFEDVLALCAHTALADFGLPLCLDLEHEAFQAGRYDIAARAGMMAFERNPDPLVAYDIGCALARSGRADEAMNWIERAVEGGFKDRDKLDTDPDLDTLRGQPEFQHIYNKLADAPA